MVSLLVKIQNVQSAADQMFPPGCLPRGQLLQHWNEASSSPAMGKEAEQGVPVVAARLLPHQLVQVLPKLVLVHVVDAPQVHLGK